MPIYMKNTSRIVCNMGQFVYYAGSWYNEISTNMNGS